MDKRSHPGGQVELDAESAEWVRTLSVAGAERERSLAELHARLLRIARSEVHRRSVRSQIAGPELDDIAHQAAADALLAIIAKLDQFRGEARFTTWAYKFVVLEVSSKLGRHFWRHPSVPLDDDGWARLPAAFGLEPDQVTERLELLAAVRHAAEDDGELPSPVGVIARPQFLGQIGTGLRGQPPGARDGVLDEHQRFDGVADTEGTRKPCRRGHRVSRIINLGLEWHGHSVAAGSRPVRWVRLVGASEGDVSDPASSAVLDGCRVGLPSDRDQSMGTRSLWQDAVASRIADLLREIERVRGLWLAGSLVRGDADRLSDIDFVVAVDDHDLGDTATMLEAVFAREFDIVLLRNRGFGQFRLLNLVTVEWERLDFSLYPAAAIAESPLRGLRRMFDKDEIGAHVEEASLPAPAPPADQVDYTLTEFARVLGLLPVVMHRDDLVGAIAGSGLLREHLVALFSYERVDKPARGALNETAQLTSEGAKVLVGLPPLAANRASILGFNLACLAAFLEHGPRVADRYGVEWPGRLVDALHARLAREFHDEFAIQQDGAPD